MPLTTSSVLTGSISGGNLILHDLFRQGFYIPSYQRQYEWSQDHILSLLDDLHEAAISGGFYYLGTLVLIEQKIHAPLPPENFDSETTQAPDLADEDHSAKKGIYDRYEVLDGQQRLTTLLIAFAVMRDILGKASNPLFFPGDPYGSIPAHPILTYDIRPAVNQLWINHLEKPGTTIIGGKISPHIQSKFSDKDITIKHISLAVKHIYEYLTDSSIITTISSLYAFMMSRTYTSCIATSSFTDSYRMFNVLNSRGLRLNDSDIIKASNLSNILGINQSTYAQLWEAQQSSLDENFESVFSIGRDVLLCKRTKMTILEDWEKSIPSISSSLKQGLGQTNKIFLLCDIYRDVFVNKIKAGQDFNNLIIAFQAGFRSTDWMAAIIKIFDNHPSIDTVNPGELLEFTEAIYKKSLYDWMFETPSTRATNVLKILHDIDKCTGLSVIQTLNKLNQSGSLSFNKKRFIKRINEDIYGAHWVRALLLLREYFLHKSLGKPFNSISICTIEHVLPATPDWTNGSPPRRWCDWYTNTDHDECVNKVGNLTLLDQAANSRLKNNCFDSKLAKYYKSGSVGVFLTQGEVCLLTSFTKTELRKRQAKIVKEMRRLF